MNKIKGSIDTRGPLKPIHLIYNRKRESLMQEKTDKILMENQILLRKMMNIDTRNPTKKGLKGQKQIQGNSLNYSLIKKNMININTENHVSELLYIYIYICIYRQSSDDYKIFDPNYPSAKWKMTM